MQPLEQQELLEVAPKRRVIVPRGHTAWYGVDPSTVRVSIAYVAPDGSRDATTTPFPRCEGPARLSAIYRDTRVMVEGLLNGMWGLGWPKPGAVLIEQPSGKMENPNLSYAVGVIQAAVYDGLAEGYDPGVPVETTTSSHWKKVACGRGDIRKPKRQGDPYPVLEWARANGYAGFSWDEADALGIAECARREIGLVER